ncbi:hypothetical protein GCM10007298_40100 [Williamsia phyllosphaerae]|uniref:Uncharacterized protein n=1 Tax=Williamsia phyllosphaerae TaxID=885042 RepID=A0ABQ1V7A8_9NOCA|nr:hypothetical protein GCM10007298_40100 [Williamsia phyllosphaerae]
MCAIMCTCNGTNCDTFDSSDQIGGTAAALTEHSHTAQESIVPRRPRPAVAAPGSASAVESFRRG